MKILLFLIANAISFACGGGFLALGWLLATFAIDYVMAIFAEGDDVHGGNFRNLSNDEFGKSETNIKMATVRNLLVSAVFFGIGYVAKLLDWL